MNLLKFLINSSVNSSPLDLNPSRRSTCAESEYLVSTLKFWNVFKDIFTSNFLVETDDLLCKLLSSYHLQYSTNIQYFI